MWVQIGNFTCICGETVHEPLIIDEGPLGED